jgi:hypothetical protein
MVKEKTMTEREKSMLHRMVHLAKAANHCLRKDQTTWCQAFDAGGALAYTQAAQDILGIWNRSAYTANYRPRR